MTACCQIPCLKPLVASGAMHKDASLHDLMHGFCCSTAWHQMALVLPCLGVLQAHSFLFGFGFARRWSNRPVMPRDTCSLWDALVGVGCFAVPKGQGSGSWAPTWWDSVRPLKVMAVGC